MKFIVGLNIPAGVGCWPFQPCSYGDSSPPTTPDPPATIVAPTPQLPAGPPIPAAPAGTGEPSGLDHGDTLLRLADLLGPTAAAAGCVVAVAVTVNYVVNQLRWDMRAAFAGALGLPLTVSLADGLQAPLVYFGDGAAAASAGSWQTGSVAMMALAAPAGTIVAWLEQRRRTFGRRWTGVGSGGCNCDA